MNVTNIPLSTHAGIVAGVDEVLDQLTPAEKVIAKADLAAGGIADTVKRDEVRRLPAQCTAVVNDLELDRPTGDIEDCHAGSSGHGSSLPCLPTVFAARQVALVHRVGEGLRERAYVGER